MGVIRTEKIGNAIHTFEDDVLSSIIVDNGSGVPYEKYFDITGNLKRLKYKGIDDNYT